VCIVSTPPPFDERPPSRSEIGTAAAGVLAVPREPPLRRPATTGILVVVVLTDRLGVTVVVTGMVLLVVVAAAVVDATRVVAIVVEVVVIDNGVAVVIVVDNVARALSTLPCVTGETVMPVPICRTFPPVNDVAFVTVEFEFDNLDNDESVTLSVDNGCPRYESSDLLAATETDCVVAAVVLRLCPCFRPPVAVLPAVSSDAGP